MFCPLRYIVSFIFMCLAHLSMFAQGFDFFPDEDNKKYPHHYHFALGASNFLGDLGGKNGIGTNDFKDLEVTQFNFAAMAGYRHCFLQNLYGRADFAYGRVSGNDNLTQEVFRHNRNLNFRSDIFEVDLMAELWIKLHMKKGHQYNLKRVDAVSGPWNMRGMYMTLFGGIGYFHFNPKANFQGQWVALNPLRTEGQGLLNGPSPYRLNQFNIPVGMSLMFRLDKQWSFGIELTYRYTFTDYIDDTSTNYYDPAIIAASNANGQGEIAAYLSDPSLGVANGGLGNYVTAPGQQRGDPTNRDGYMYALIKADYWVMNKAKFKSAKRPGSSRRRR